MEQREFAADDAAAPWGKPAAWTSAADASQPAAFAAWTNIHAAPRGALRDIAEPLNREMGTLRIVRDIFADMWPSAAALPLHMPYHNDPAISAMLQIAGLRCGSLMNQQPPNTPMTVVIAMAMILP